MNNGLAHLHLYPFERLAEIRRSITLSKTKSPIDLSIGEPKHPTPAFIIETLNAHLGEVAKYPATRGTEALRQVFVDWLIARYRLPAQSLSAESNVLPVNGTREALFAIAQCVINKEESRPTVRPIVIMPNPFYQIYEGAALLAGAEPYFVNCLSERNFVPDFDAVPEEIWERCQLIYLCSPANPTGTVLDVNTFIRLMELADRYDFVIASDECYSEIYSDENHPPVGLLQAAAHIERTDYHRCLVFNSLSKRSSVPGLRSGLVAGDAALIRSFLSYRTYHGCAMPFYAQAASQAAWQDEAHVLENRRLYREKMNAVLEILAPVLEVKRPAASFCLWPETPLDDVGFTRGLWERENVTVLPGSFLARPAAGRNPGHNHVRMALVPSLGECVDAATRIRNYLNLL